MPQADTKQRILEAAESLFTSNGYDNTSLRQITSTADVNLAAVNYHFGGKEQLLFELVHTRLEPINRERIERLDNLQPGFTTEDVIRCFLEPAIKHFQNCPDNLPCILGQAHREQNQELRKFIAGELRPIAEKFFSVAQQALPHLGIDVIIARTEFMVGALFHWMHTQIQVGRILAPDQAQLSESSFVAEQLIKFCTAGFNDE